MNKERRKKIQDIINKPDNIKTDIEALATEEQDALDNVPDSLQESDQAQLMDEKVTYLNDAASELDTVIQDLQSAAE